VSDAGLARLPREFYARPAHEVAPELLGCVLGHETADGLVAVELTEVEAYAGDADPASHAYRGRTARNAVMFGPPGHLYVYFTYGMHHCANVVTERDGVAGAVLLRAAAVEEGLSTVSSRRGGVTGAALLRGPGNLCRGLGITRADDGIDLLDPASRIHIDQRPGTPPIAVSPRVGLRHAADRLLRFSWLGDPAVSRPVPRAARADQTKEGAGLSRPLD
jgi:DNA-3-methyladenine glycosylase